ncbi:hypothetical protein HQR03_13620 [Psychrobacter okhotskensis]|uniref:hypothetical protein n=1 Tax=Psychrobacter okhotskensis TaxID=212403 RepID=UPI001563389D|nr:hypothetical protein [Psychrobacter okhotskensis]NRD71569.1 hypothetical protein [Psychrobacter okhotskensis]
MAILPKDYLSIYDVADYLNELGYEYDLNQSFDRYKLNKDIYDFVLHNQIKIVHKALTIDFTYAYIILPEYFVKGILIEDNIVNGGGNCSLIYKHEDGSYPKKGAERISVDDYPINIDSIYIPKAELDNLFNKKTEEQLLLNIAELETELAQVKAQLEKQADTPTDDKELPSNSQAGVARMLYAILTEHDYDLSPQKGKGVANDLIVNASNNHGTSVTRNFVADWLIRAREAKINNTK